MADDLDIGNESFSTTNMSVRSNEEINSDYLGKLAANSAVIMMQRKVIVAHQKITPGESRFYDREFDYDGRSVLIMAVKDVTPEVVLTLDFSDLSTDTYIMYGATIDMMIQVYSFSTSYSTLDAHPPGSGNHDPLYIRAVSGGGFEVHESDTDTEDLTFNVILIVLP